jgi:zinc D-Ala-D-Ala carboxypeptidase
MASATTNTARALLIGAAVLLAAVLAYFLFRGAKYAGERMSSKFKYFTFSEFDSPDEPGSGQAHMSEDFIRRLDKVRAAVGFPLLITSGYRTEAHNAKVGGVPGSAHTKGLAADIRALTDTQKRAIAKAAIAQGIKRIGWGRTYIHLDIDGTKPQNVVWNYPGTTAPSFNSLA